MINVSQMCPTTCIVSALHIKGNGEQKLYIRAQIIFLLKIL